MTDAAGVMERLAKHVLTSRSASATPERVQRKAALHTLDTLAAMASGSRLLPGAQGRRYVAGRSGGAVGPCTVVGARRATTPLYAAIANGMAAHADETDDSHAMSLTHPGCSVVPAALAMAEERGRSVGELVRAVSVGYDVGCRYGRMINKGRGDVHRSGLSSHSVFGGTGAIAAACTLCDFGEEEVGYAFSYYAQLASGVTNWVRDGRHVLKAFVFAGMPASHAVLAADLVGAGWDGPPDPFSGDPNWPDALVAAPKEWELFDDLGDRFEVEEATIKKYSVGSPAQAAVEAAVEMTAGTAIEPDRIRRIEIHLPADSAGVVDGRHMPSINVQYLVAATLTRGAFSFALAHDEEYFASPTVAGLRERTTLVPDPALEGTRYGELTVEVEGEGAPRHRRVEDVQGTPRNPMPAEQVVAKATELLAPVTGDGPAERVVELVTGCAEVPVAELGRLLQADEPAP